MGLFSWLFGRKDPAPPVAVEKPVQDMQTVAPEALSPADGVVLQSGPAPGVPVEERPRRKAYVPPPDTPENRRRAAFYDRERANAAAEGRSVKQLRAGLIGREETKAALQILLDSGGTEGLRLGSCSKGLTVALPDGRLIEPSAPMLRRFGIYGAKIMGTGYHRAGESDRPEGMELGLKREPNNPHDSNAVALTRGSRPQQVGYVAKGQARFVAKAMDGGDDLVAHAIMGGDWVLITSHAKWSELSP